MSNIIWKKPDGGVAVTSLSAECLRLHAFSRVYAASDDPRIQTEIARIRHLYGTNVETHGQMLQARGKVPADWVCVGHGVSVNLQDPQRNKWVWQDNAIQVKS